jgi:hypothetical protein
MVFQLTMTATVVVWIGAAVSLHNDLVLPLVAGLLFFLAAATALFAWCRRHGNDPRQLTLWDVAGALVLIGIGAAALVEPDQLLRLVGGAQS